MRIERVKNFLSLEECFLLNEWVGNAIKNEWMGIGGPTNRYTTRMFGYRFQYPKNILNISNKIRLFCGIDCYETIKHQGRDGITVSSIFKNGDVLLHKDPKAQNNLSVLRCNVLTQKAEYGGDLYINGKYIDIEIGELHCYLVSEIPHEVTKVFGDTHRIMWMFGAEVPAEDWESGKIQIGKTN